MSAPAAASRTRFTAEEFAEVRARPIEQQRVGDLLAAIPDDVHTVLDVGARDGFISARLADSGRRVTALDLEQPVVDHPAVQCVRGDARDLAYPDGAFDLVLCAEVLEHIPQPHLSRVCGELSRVAARHVLIGVPYRQDLRVGRMTCRACGAISPPWGHVNSFDEDALVRLFPGMRVARARYVGPGTETTNALAAKLMDWAGNPYGTYGQEEPCVSCGTPLEAPSHRTLLARLIARAAFAARRLPLEPASDRRANWIHVLFSRDARVTAS